MMSYLSIVEVDYKICLLETTTTTEVFCFLSAIQGFNGSKISVVNVPIRVCV